MNRNKSILLVEDNQDHVVLALRALKIAGIENEVVVMPDGEQALAFLTGQKSHELPHVILLDLGLPGISGLDVLRQVRKDVKTKTMPVVMLSTSDEVTDRRQSYALGANSYILKPLDFKRFLYVIERVSEYWLQLNQAYS